MKLIISQVQQVEKKIDSVKVNKSKVDSNSVSPDTASNHSNIHFQTKKEIAHVVEKMCHQLDTTAKERIVTLSGEI